MVTFAVGCESRTTLNSAVPPSSVVIIKPGDEKVGAVETEIPADGGLPPFLPCRIGMPLRSFSRSTAERLPLATLRTRSEKLEHLLE